MKANSEVLNGPWLITPEAFARIAEQEVAFSIDDLKASLDKSLLTVQDGIGIISITGPLMRKPDLFAILFDGATAMESIHAAISDALAAPDVRSILLDIDSPGGTVNGTPELANAVAEATKSKPVYAWTGDLMASAAYWIGSQANAVFAAPSARVGSIGVLYPVIDRTKMLDNMGIRVDLIKAGKHKGAGFIGTSLSDEQRENIQAQVDEIHGDFKAAVLARGRKIPAEAMEGQVFSARQAQKFNLAGTMDRAGVLAKMKGLNSARVDTRTRAMKTVDEQLAEASAENTRLASEISTQSALLDEQSKTIATLTGDLDASKAKVTALESQVTELTGKFNTVQARNTELEASEQDIEKRASLKAADIAASMGSRTPAPVTPGKQVAETAEELRAQLAQCHDPRERGKIIAKLAALRE